MLALLALHEAAVAGAAAVEWVNGNVGRGKYLDETPRLPGPLSIPNGGLEWNGPSPVVPQTRLRSRTDGHLIRAGGQKARSRPWGPTTCGEGNMKDTGAVIPSAAPAAAAVASSAIRRQRGEKMRVACNVLFGLHGCG